MSRRSRYTGEWSSVDCTCDILDKKRSIFNYVMLMFDRTSQMFEYTGLPDTIPQYMVEKFLQVNGHVGFVEWDGNIYALPGSMGGAPDPYYRPTHYIIANPALGGSKDCRIVNHFPPYDSVDWTDKPPCVLMKNDTNYRGLLYIFSRYATEMAENDVSIRSAQINSRQQTLITATTDPEIASAKAYIDGLEAGKIAAVHDQSFLVGGGVRATNLSVQSANVLLQLIELQQYLKASWYNEIGLNANYNMKREYLSEEELRASSDALLPLIDDMLYCREQALSVVNSTFGTNISVKKNSAWDNKQEELDISGEEAKAKVEALKSQSEEGGDGE